jgi:8-oxo-dGTP pyrophosphatase MutT (NUDIX family)
VLEEKSAGLVIFRMDGDNPSYLLLHYGWGHWGFSKGNIEAGETEKEAAIREAKEETGLNNFKFLEDFMEKIEYFYKRKGKRIHKEVIYFLVETEEKEVQVSYEHKGFEWLKLEEALNLLSFNNTKEILKRASEAIEKGVYLSHN